MPSFNPSDCPQVAGKCFLVTGASSGIGRETALLLAELGATVILNGRNEARLEETRTRMKGEGHLVAPADLCATSCLPWLKELLNTMRKSLAGVAHCAGTHAFSPLRAYRAEALEETLRGQAVVMANLFHAVSRLKAREVSCSLVAMSSISAHFGIVGNGLYGASRAASESLCRSFAVEFAQLNIRCNMVCGGFMEGSGMADGGGALLGEDAKQQIAVAYPLGLGHVSDAANAIVFLLGGSSHWITGAVLPVDGGASVKGS